MNQDRAFQILHEGHNVFLTGPAGAGKTYTLNRFIEEQRKLEKRIAVTASTGIAATHMGGKTIHSWSGMPVMDRDGNPKTKISAKEVRYLQGRKHLKESIPYTDILIIDEISMLHDYSLDMLDKILRGFRVPDLPFGGLQVIMAGDFFQLPPVSKNAKVNHFAFKAKAWQNADLKICYLEEQHRQTDQDFIYLLNAIRDNRIAEDKKAQNLIKLYPSKEDDVIKLFTHNADIDSYNGKKLRSLKGDVKEFRMTSEGIESLVKGLKKSCLAPELLRLKVGAPVMFLKNNFEEGYVNGTTGKVVDFSKGGHPMVEVSDGTVHTVKPGKWAVPDDTNPRFWETNDLAAIHQYPLRLAWSITVHKSQGMSLDAAEMNLQSVFVEGQGYVALSRVRSLEGLRLTGISKLALRVNPEITEVDKEFRQLSADHSTTQQALL